VEGDGFEGWCLTDGWLCLGFRRGLLLMGRGRRAEALGRIRIMGCWSSRHKTTLVVGTPDSAATSNLPSCEADENAPGLFIRRPNHDERFANWEKSAAGLREDEDGWVYVPPVEGVHTVILGEPSNPVPPTSQPSAIIVRDSD
jgi:hypothetical protein